MADAERGKTRANANLDWFWFYFCSVEERITRVFYGNRLAQLIRNQYYFSILKWKVLRASNSIITSRSHVNFVSNLLFKWSTTREIEWELFSENDIKEIKISPLMLAPLSKVPNDCSERKQSYYILFSMTFKTCNEDVRPLPLLEIGVKILYWANTYSLLAVVDLLVQLLGKQVGLFTLTRFTMRRKYR